MGLQLTAAVLSKLWPHADATMVAVVARNSGEAFLHYGMTVSDIVDFMAECSEETGGGMAFVESGAYSAERAHEVWPSLFPTAQSAQIVVGNPKALFDKTYGGRLGNVAGTDDGYNFRGRGMIQITGRTWYTEIAKETGLALLDNPDLAADPEHLLECALAYWRLADVNALVGDLRAEVKRINGGYTNMAARESWEKICATLLTAEALAIPVGPMAAPAAQVSAVPTSVPSPPKPPAILAKPGDPSKGMKVHPSLMAEIEAVLLKWF